MLGRPTKTEGQLEQSRDEGCFWRLERVGLDSTKIGGLFPGVQRQTRELCLVRDSTPACHNNQTKIYSNQIEEINAIFLFHFIVSIKKLKANILGTIKIDFFEMVMDIG